MRFGAVTLQGRRLPRFLTSIEIHQAPWFVARATRIFVRWEKGILETAITTSRRRERSSTKPGPRLRRLLLLGLVFRAKLPQIPSAWLLPAHGRSNLLRVRSPRLLLWRTARPEFFSVAGLLNARKASRANSL